MGNGSEWRSPDPVGSTLRLSAGGPAGLAWAAVAQANVYNVYRGSLGPAGSIVTTGLVRSMNQV